ncbi:MAG TPA: hypothetical protein VFQ61_35835 [Polyangiaceae bacterium]|nr:hypothetical protein [Polyangiaceae bacterium]
MQAKPECTSRADLAARVESRLPHVRFVVEGTALVARARFTRLASGNVLGEVRLEGPGGAMATRRIVAQSCTQAAEAIALVISVTVDPNALLSTGSTNSGKVSEGSSLPTRGERATSPSDAGEVTAGGLETKPVESPNLPAPAVNEQSANGSDQDSSGASTLRGSDPVAFSGKPYFGTYVTAHAGLGVAPRPMMGVALYALAALESEGLFAPALMLGAAHVARNGFVEQGGKANFELDTLSLDACPVRVRWELIGARACIWLLGGRLTATGSATSSPTSVHRPFLAGGGSAVLTARLLPALELSARAAVGANFVRDSFEFSPFVFHTVSPVFASLSLGLGIRSR